MEETRHYSALIRHQYMDNKTVSQLGKLFRQTEALRRAMELVASGTTPDHAKWSATNSFVRAYNRFAQKYHELSHESVMTFNEDSLRSWAESLWPIQKGLFDQVYSELLILTSQLSDYENGASASISELSDLLSSNLRKVIFSKPNKESEVQNAVESLLVGRGYQKGVHYDRESGRVKYSGKDFIPDFNFHSLNTALEIKLIREGISPSTIVEQLSADIPAYKSAYSSILFCVYDLGSLRDVHEFQNDLQNTDGVRVCVVKH
jgi:hypothetical protein